VQITLGTAGTNFAATANPSLYLRSTLAQTGPDAAQAGAITPESHIEVVFQFLTAVKSADFPDSVSQLLIKYDATKAGLASIKGALLRCGEDGSGVEAVAAHCFQR
jgi:hypothetical protein